MGGKKFDTAQPEGYLFGDNADLNYLGPKPHNVGWNVFYIILRLVYLYLFDSRKCIYPVLWI